MNEPSLVWLPPAVIVALLAVTCQSIFAIGQAIHNKRVWRSTRKSLEVQYVVALFDLIDGLPLSSATKAEKKLEIAADRLSDEVPEELQSLLVGGKS